MTMLPSRLPFIFASELDGTPTTVSSREDTIGQQTESLGKMSISFLMNDEPDMQRNRRRTPVSGGRNCTDAWYHSQVTSTFSAHGLQPEEQSNRTGRWVVSQAVTLPSDSDSGYAADSEESALCGSGRPVAKFSDQVDVASLSNAFPSNSFPSNAFPSNTFPSNAFPSRVITSADQQSVDSEAVLLADTKLLRPADFRLPAKRSRSHRLVYTREEKLFIMHARVLRNMDWADISRTFEIIFGSKNTNDTISGLRSIYYRTRREWGMDYVTRSGSAEVQSDMRIVSEKLREHAETMMASDKDRRRTSRLRHALEKLTPATQSRVE